MATVQLEDYLWAADPWHEAFKAAGQGGTVRMDSGAHPGPMETVPHGITLEGVGNSSQIVRRAGWHGPTVDANLRDYVTIRNLRVVGNYPSFVGFEGFMNGEICINGTGNRVEGCTVEGFKRYGIEANGVSPTITNNVVTGVGDTLNSAYGIVVPESGATKDARVVGNVVRNTYSAGIIAGGFGGAVQDNDVGNCHIGFLPVGVGGGQIAIARTTSGGVLTQSNGFVVSGNRVSPSTGPVTSGIELDSCYDIVLANNMVMGQFNLGISVHKASSITIVGGVVAACDGVGVRVAEGCYAVTVSSLVLRANRCGVAFEGPASNLLTLMGCTFLYQRERNYRNTTYAPNVTLIGNQWDTLDPVQ